MEDHVVIKRAEPGQTEVWFRNFDGAGEQAESSDEEEVEEYR